MAEDFPPQERRSSLTISIWEGVFAQFHTVIVGGPLVLAYLSAYIKTTSDFRWVYLSAIPPLAGLIQLFSAHWLQSNMHLRKPFTIITATLSRFAWLFIAAIPFLFSEAKALTLFFMVYAIISLILAMAGNSWISWMADIIPAPLRGRYFSKRNLLCALVYPTGVIAGRLYDFFKANYSIQLVGIFSFAIPAFMDKGQSIIFILVGTGFIIAVFAGALPSLILLIKQPEPPYVKPAPKNAQDTSKDKVTIWDATREILRNKDLKNIFLVMIIWHIVNGFAAPFWGPFRLLDLEMTVTALFICDLLLAPICTILSLLVWGKIIDRFGNKTVIMFTLYITAFHPLLYVVSTPNFTALMYLDAISSGLMWSGFGVAILNIQLAFFPKHGRVMYFALYAAIVSGLAYTITMFISMGAVKLLAGHKFLSLPAIPIVLWLVSIGRFSCLIWFSKINDPKEKPMSDLVWHLILQAKEGFTSIPKFFMPKAGYNILDNRNDESPTKPQ